MQFHFHANQSHFHKIGFALRLALKQRHKGTRKWPISNAICGLCKFQNLLNLNFNKIMMIMMMQCFSFLNHGLAPSTRRSHASAQAKFVSFYQQLDKLHPSGCQCPRDKWMLCLFVTFLARTLQDSSIKVYLSGIRALHINQGFLDLLADCLRLQRVVRGISGDARALLHPHSCLLQMT